MRVSDRLLSPLRLEVVAAVSIVVFGLVATPAVADTIYLKNGRIIHTSTARIEGDKVEFQQYGGWIVLPMSVVDRVEQNERRSPEGSSTPATGTTASPDEGAAGDTEAAGGGVQAVADEGQATGGEGGDADGQETTVGEEGQEGSQAEQADEPPPEETRVYWRTRLEPLFRQMDRIEADLERYRPMAATSAGAAARVEQLERRLAEIETRVQAIQSEARRLGVPPGWVRR